MAVRSKSGEKSKNLFDDGSVENHRINDLYDASAVRNLEIPVKSKNDQRRHTLTIRV